MRAAAVMIPPTIAIPAGADGPGVVWMPACDVAAALAERSIVHPEASRRVHDTGRTRRHAGAPFVDGRGDATEGPFRE